jgi:hypothetical protein
MKHNLQVRSCLLPRTPLRVLTLRVDDAHLGVEPRIEALERLERLVLGLVSDEPVVTLVVRSVSWNQSKTSRGTDVEPPRDVEGCGARVPVTADEEDSRVVRRRDLAVNDTTGHVVLGENVDKVATLYCHRAVGQQREPKNGRVRNVILLLWRQNKVARTSELLIGEVGREDVVMPDIYVPEENTRLWSVDVWATAEETSTDEVAVVHAVGVEIRVAYGERTCNRRIIGRRTHGRGNRARRTVRNLPWRRIIPPSNKAQDVREDIPTDRLQRNVHGDRRARQRRHKRRGEQAEVKTERGQDSLER